MSFLNEWDSFYVIVGSSAGALIGLQFVVMTLIAEKQAVRTAEAGAAFGTPTVVHFSAVLLLSAILRAPWQSIPRLTGLLGLLGLAGVVYAVIVARRMLRQEAYTPVLEDWVFHLAFPFAAYVLLAVAPFAAPTHPRGAFFCIGAASLLLLFTGIHNAWDAVAYQVFMSGTTHAKGSKSDKH